MIDRKTAKGERVSPRVKLSYRGDYEYERLMIAQVQTEVVPATCICCGEEYRPRFIGEQICGKHR